MATISKIKIGDITYDIAVSAANVSGLSDAIAAQSGGVDIKVAAVQPSEQNTGDFWYQTT